MNGIDTTTNYSLPDYYRNGNNPEVKINAYYIDRVIALIIKMRTASSKSSKKAKELIKLITWLDYDCPAKEKEIAFQSLDSHVQCALDDLWEKYYARPKSNGHWSGEDCNSIWIPDDDYTPPNKSYSNLHGLTWREIKQKHDFKGLRCERGRFCFEDIAKYRVSIPNFAELVTSSDRESLHEVAFATLARQIGKTVEEVKAIKESRGDQTSTGQKNLVWHEDIDCETLYLVPQEIHGNIIHFGGVALCQLLRKHKLI